MATDSPLSRVQLVIRTTHFIQVSLVLDMRPWTWCCEMDGVLVYSSLLREEGWESLFHRWDERWVGVEPTKISLS